ncbi:MAG TPA: hypothetical protein VK933_05655 [Longimicrobiales bacterium]|nr:hypothetical protein [Longimicrobiales bacterium]
MTKDDAIELPGLVGAWLSEDGDTTIVTALGGEYEFEMSEKEGFGSQVARAGYRARRPPRLRDRARRLESDAAAGITETMLGTVILATSS